MRGSPPRIAPLGEAGLTISFATTFSDEAHRAVLAAASAVRGADLPAVIELVPGAVALSILYDPAEATFRELSDRILLVLATDDGAAALAAGRRIEIPVSYDGPDLADVARRTGLSVSEVIERHTAVEYEVALLGFVPGFGYLGPLDPRLVLPRRETPRARVPAGSVAIAGAQTGIYPAETPGGWHLIGRTTARMFDPARDPPSLLAVGDRVTFVAR